MPLLTEEQKLSLTLQQIQRLDDWKWWLKLNYKNNFWPKFCVPQDYILTTFEHPFLCLNPTFYKNVEEIRIRITTANLANILDRFCREYQAKNIKWNFYRLLSTHNFNLRENAQHTSWYLHLWAPTDKQKLFQKIRAPQVLENLDSDWLLLKWLSGSL